MNPRSILDLLSTVRPSREAPQRPSDLHKFREQMVDKADSAEERGKKRRSPFELAAELAGLSQLSARALDNSAALSSSPSVAPLSEIACMWIVESANTLMVSMGAEGVEETSLCLGGPQFQDTIFAGTEVVIKRYSTAPLIFNIEFRGLPNAISALHPSIEQLEAHFAKLKKDYTIHRIEASLNEEAESFSPFFFHRKSPAQGNNL
jgi:hypothetical protein